MSDSIQLITLSRAARLIGVIRSELQKKIQQGELPSFDGMVDIDDLLLAYPGAQLEDDVEYRAGLADQGKGLRQAHLRARDAGRGDHGGAGDRVEQGTGDQPEPGQAVQALLLDGLTTS